MKIIIIIIIINARPIESGQWMEAK